MSPSFAWTGVPEGTKTLAITLTDLTFGQPLWAIWNIPVDAGGLPANLGREPTLTEPEGAEQSNATFATEDGYFGPEAGCNVFEFRLFALSAESFAPANKDYAADVDAELNQLGTDVLLGRTSLFAQTTLMCE